MIGQSLGRYHILEQLGEGGMATVYKAFDSRLEREVAVKVLLQQRQLSEKFLKRFEREAKALAQLSHPNIVKVLDFGEHEGIPYLVMEYIPGGTLKQKLGKPVPPAEAARILFPIARALEYAHQHKIIHRDIKPANILLTESGQPMLSDFGIAKILQEEETMDLTGTGVGVGTPEYMAPEQGLGRAVDHRADIYALGIVFYELITGRKPFKADTPMAVVIKQINDPLPRPKQYVKELPDAIERVVFKALAKNPEDRFNDMAAFALVLESLAKGGKVSIGRVVAPKGVLQQRLLLAAGLLLGVGILAIVSWFSVGNRQGNWLFPRTAVVAVTQVTATPQIIQVTATHFPTPSSLPSFTPSPTLTPTAPPMFPLGWEGTDLEEPIIEKLGNYWLPTWATVSEGALVLDNQGGDYKDVILIELSNIAGDFGVRATLTVDKLSSHISFLLRDQMPEDGTWWKNSRRFDIWFQNGTLSPEYRHGNSEQPVGDYLDAWSMPRGLTYDVNIRFESNEMVFLVNGKILGKTTYKDLLERGQLLIGFNMGPRSRLVVQDLHVEIPADGSTNVTIRSP